MHRLLEEGATSSSKELRAEGLVAPNVWRNGGVIAGELAARLPPGGAEHTVLVDNMFTFWRTFVERERTEAGAGNAVAEMERLITDGVNPFDHRGTEGAQRRDDAARSAARGRVVAFWQVGKEGEQAGYSVADADTDMQTDTNTKTDADTDTDNTIKNKGKNTQSKHHTKRERRRRRMRRKKGKSKNNLL